ncbi:hypothetical protein B7R21_16330 [Subtercola boreus]|uniref:DUF5107 domain-containing protein n=1 Tax=Subtercola boreus TaxID=120213 RepID=A0A3E0VE61_9MICO|nr:DUF5107 domain-containing protein [Subtercola boreus]RFA07157.1 hypothetical protein B7R21_16330 [Subtercola boreus]
MLSEESKIDLPSRPSDQDQLAVAAWPEALTIDTYATAEPDRYPQFLDARVYQGSSGRVFPLPFHERVETEKHPHSWQAIHLDNEWLRLVILPQLGGRIHIAYDKSADYDIFYRNNVIKPALVGLAGPWISGGVEFNWPQHHRPATYLPTDVSIEREEDGSVTVWCSDHDPFDRMKGMHGIRLRPGSSVIEARVRLFNRSEQTRTFLWWANVAAAVNEDYQSFFPTDVHHVADHAKRATTGFPAASGEYYGVDYPARADADHPDADRLDWYRNIPVPTSYMVVDSEESFFGGYDHARAAGFVHWADRSISPGKKQWTWGDAPFGHTWNANLTDTDGPYIELMAGVYTDNQPDFSFLAPGETKTFSQFWYPISSIGPAMQATRDGALRVTMLEGGELRVGVATTARAAGAIIQFLDAHGTVVSAVQRDLAPDAPAVFDWAAPVGVAASELEVRVVHGGRTLVAHSWRPAGEPLFEPSPAVAPPAPEDVATIEELHLTATYLQQYRHATRSPEPYWLEAIERDPDDLRSNTALGALRYESARYDDAIDHLQRAVSRQTRWAPNPPDGEAHYRLGLALRRAGRLPEAQKAFATSSWNAAQSTAAHLALARMLAEQDPAGAFEHARQALRGDSEHLQVRDLLVVLLRTLGRPEEATAILDETLRLDPLDQWARDLAGLRLTDDAPTLLDTALEYVAMGDRVQGERLLVRAGEAVVRSASGQVNVGPLVAYHLAASALSVGDLDRARAHIRSAASLDATNALPSRLDDIDALLRVAAFAPDQPLLWSLLGSWYFAHDRQHDAVDAWTRGTTLDPDPDTRALLERNLGIAAYNVQHSPTQAMLHFATASAARPNDSRLLYESDQLAARTGVGAPERLARLDARPDLVAERDDLTVERAVLLTTLGRADEAQTILAGRRFQPWEGGEGIVLTAWDRAALAHGRRLLADGDAAGAVSVLDGALDPPSTLGEARHPFATAADLHLLRGDALARLGQAAPARDAWERAASSTGDFSGMMVATFTERSAWAIVALQRLNRRTEAEEALDAFLRFIEDDAVRPAEVDFFATSLPSMLLFHDSPTDERDRRTTRLRNLHRAISAELNATEPDGTD